MFEHLKGIYMTLLTWYRHHRHPTDIEMLCVYWDSKSSKKINFPNPYLEPNKNVKAFEEQQKFISTRVADTHIVLKCNLCLNTYICNTWQFFRQAYQFFWEEKLLDAVSFFSNDYFLNLLYFKNSGKTHCLFSKS